MSCLVVFKRLLLCVWFCCFIGNAFSSKYYFDHLTVGDGLSANIVKSTFVDSYGYAWIGTFGGVDCYDGIDTRSFNSYFKGEPKSVTSFAEDDEGRLWIGSEEGLFYWDRISDTFSNVSILDHKEINISNIRYYANDILFIGSDVGFFLVNVRTKNIESILFHEQAKHPLNCITDFIIDDNLVYISTKGGFLQYDISLKQTLIFNIGSGKANKYASYVTIAKYKDDIYLGCGLQGMVKYSLKNQQLQEVVRVEDSKIRSLLIHKHKLFIGTESHGLNILDLDTNVWEKYGHVVVDPTSMSSNSVTSVYVDRNEVMWIGTYLGGLNFTSLLANVFNVYSPDGTLLLNESIRSLYFHQNKYKFFGTRNGLYVIDDDEKVKCYTADDEALGANIILKIHNYYNKILIGTYGGGISSYSFETNELELWKDDVFHDEYIYAFEEDRNGNLWIGGFSGIYMVSPSGEVLSFNKKNSVFNDFLAYDIKVDKNNHIWVGGTSGASVYGYKNNQFTLIKQLDLGTSVKVVYFHFDSNDKVWIGTIKQGVFKFDLSFNCLKNITKNDGLCSNVVTSIIEAKPKELWFSTLNGLTLYNQKTDSCFNFYSSSGLPGVNYCRGASYVDDEGYVWLGNEKGLVYFKHDDICFKGSENNVRITDLFVGGKPLQNEVAETLDKPVEDLEYIELPLKFNSIGFRFANLNSQLAETTSFVVKFEGIDEDWINLFNKNDVYYNALKPGEYIFSVGVRNEAGNVDEKSIRSMAITIKPEWHNSKLTIIAVFSVLLMFIALLLYYLSNYRKKTANKLQSNEVGKERYETSALDIENSKHLLLDIQKYVESAQAYLNADLKIAHVSEALDVSVHDISQAINQNLNQGFTDFINGYRIEECKQRLQSSEYEKHTLLAVAETCGFNSKSSFNRAFKKTTGQTPSEYLISIENK